MRHIVALPWLNLTGISLDINDLRHTSGRHAQSWLRTI